MKKMKKLDRGAGPYPASLEKALKNDYCGYCGRKMTKEEGEYRRTKEHLVPKSITGSRPYDFMACRLCGNKKSRLDELIAWIVKFGDVNTNRLDRLDIKSLSCEGRKSLKAILKHINLIDPSFVTHRGDEFVGLHGRWRIVEFLTEWTKWFARGIYFLETGKILRYKEGMRYPDRMILSELLLASDMVGLTRLGFDEIGAAAKIFRPAPNAQAWGDIWLDWKSIKYPAVACLCLGGKYVLAATVAPYNKDKLLVSANLKLLWHHDPRVRNGCITDLTKYKGKWVFVLKIE